MWIERKIEGDRPKRMKLDKGGMSGRKFGLKTAKHAAWVALALWTGFTFVGYFTPITELAGKAISWSMGPWETFWVFFYGFATYGNAGWMREQVCKYMCPYARFQSVMFDRDTLIITYDEDRGEPRGSRSRSADHKAKGLGDCVDCGICVQVCPTGIDIRKGLQYECIGCAACADGCDQVMEKMGYPKGLIRYSSELALENKLDFAAMLRRVVRPRILIYTAVLWAIIIAAALTLGNRVPVKVDVIRDRMTMMAPDDPVVQNVYRIVVMNTAEKTRQFQIEVSGLEGLELQSDSQPITISGADQRVIPVRVQVERRQTVAGANPIVFTVRTVGEDQPIVIEEDATLIAPRPE